MSKPKLEEHPSLFVVKPDPVDIPPLLQAVGDRTPESVENPQPRENRAPTVGNFGRPDARIRMEPANETEWASRSSRQRRGGRYNPDLLRKTDVELTKQHYDFQDFVDKAMAFWLAMGAPNLGDWAPALLLCCSCGSKDINLNTTTTTQAVARMLPGFPKELLEMPNKSRHHQTVLWEYAQSNYRGDIPGFEGLKRPEFWVKANMRTGRDDAMVDRWLQARQTIEEETTRRLAEIDRRESEHRRLGAEARRELEERNKK